MPHSSTPIVNTQWVADHLNDPTVVLAEVNERPDLYDTGHISGAINLHWRDDLQAATSRDMIDQLTFERLMAERGIARDTTVVLYGDRSNWFATYAYWYLSSYGHTDIRIMDGGRDLWISEGRDMTTDIASRAQTTYAASPRNDAIRAFAPQVISWLSDDERVLVDVRSPAEYSGEMIAPEGYEQEGAQRAGHIPGAISIPWSSAVRSDGTFLAPDELRELYASRGVTDDLNVVAYCRIGERSAHTWFVLSELLGYDNVRNYDGSWTEWGNLVGVPIDVTTDTPAVAMAHC